MVQARPPTMTRASHTRLRAAHQCLRACVFQSSRFPSLSDPSSVRKLHVPHSTPVAANRRACCRNSLNRSSQRHSRQPTGVCTHASSRKSFTLLGAVSYSLRIERTSAEFSKPASPEHLAKSSKVCSLRGELLERNVLKRLQCCGFSICGGDSAKFVLASPHPAGEPEHRECALMCMCITTRRSQHPSPSTAIVRYAAVSARSHILTCFPAAAHSVGLVFLLLIR